MMYAGTEVSKGENDFMVTRIGCGGFMRNIIGIMLMACMLIGMNAGSAWANGSAGADWENDVLTAKGYGTPADRAKNPGHARILAHQAAMLDGYRRLAEQAKGLHVTANSSIEDNISTGDIVNGAVDAVVRRAKVISENYDEYGNCSVELQVPLYGVTNSVAKAVLKPVAREAFPNPTVSESTLAATANVTITGGYTGLIVDCSGMGLKPVMSPVIMNANQMAIYGYEKLDYDKVIADGMVSYAGSMSGNVSRAGSNPLIVKAVSIGNNNSNPIVSAADADRILLENQRSHFLDRCAVVFIR